MMPAESSGFEPSDRPDEEHDATAPREATSRSAVQIFTIGTHGTDAVFQRFDAKVNGG